MQRQAREQVKIDASVIYRSNSKLAWRVSHNFRNTHPRYAARSVLSRKVRGFNSVSPTRSPRAILRASSYHLRIKASICGANKFERYPIRKKKWSFNWLKLICLSYRATKLQNCEVGPPSVPLNGVFIALIDRTRSKKSIENSRTFQKAARTLLIFFQILKKYG